MFGDDEETISIEECNKIRLLEKLAAFVDGEGTIDIARKVTSAGNYCYNQRLKLANTNIRLIEWAVDNFGGTFPKASKGTGNRKDKYDWYLSGFKSYKLIKKIRPYLILKQEQADNAIELYEKVTKWKYNNMPRHKRKLAERLYRSNKLLNKVGKEDIDNNEEVEICVKVRKDVLDEWL